MAFNPRIIVNHIFIQSMLNWFSWRQSYHAWHRGFNTFFAIDFTNTLKYTGVSKKKATVLSSC